MLESSCFATEAYHTHFGVHACASEKNKEEMIFFETVQYCSEEWTIYTYYGSKYFAFRCSTHLRAICSKRNLTFKSTCARRVPKRSVTCHAAIPGPGSYDVLRSIEWWLLTSRHRSSTLAWSCHEYFDWNSTAASSQHFTASFSENNSKTERYWPSVRASSPVVFFSKFSVLYQKSSEKSAQIPYLFDASQWEESDVRTARSQQATWESFRHYSHLYCRWVRATAKFGIAALLSLRLWWRLLLDSNTQIVQ